MVRLILKFGRLFGLLLLMRKQIIQFLVFTAAVLVLPGRARSNHILFAASDSGSQMLDVQMDFLLLFLFEIAPYYLIVAI